MFLAGEWFGHQNLSRHPRGAVRPPQSIRVTEEGVRVTSPWPSEGGRFDHGKKPGLFLSACPQACVGRQKFWLAGLFISVWPGLPGPSLPSELSICIRSVLGKEIRSYVFLFQMWIIEPRQCGSFNKTGYGPQGEAYAQVRLSFQGTVKLCFNSGLTQLPFSRLIWAGVSAPSRQVWGTAGKSGPSFICLAIRRMAVQGL